MIACIMASKKDGGKMPDDEKKLVTSFYSLNLTMKLGYWELR